MRLMVLAKQQRWEFGLLHLRSQGDEFLVQQIPEKQLFFQSHRHGRHKRLQALRGKGQVGFEQTLKFHDRLRHEKESQDRASFG
jgi:hypothetical protein